MTLQVFYVIGHIFDRRFDLVLIRGGEGRADSVSHFLTSWIDSGEKDDVSHLPNVTVLSRSGGGRYEFSQVITYQLIHQSVLRGFKLNRWSA
jgi:hypothetical protein